MLVAFLGTHVPLLVLFFYAISIATLTFAVKVQVLGVALVATLVGTVLTLVALQQLLVPISLVARGLRHYRKTQQLPNLPHHFTDDAGVLMADTLDTLTQLDQAIQQLQNYDALTALPNRTLFQVRLQEVLATAPPQSVLAVLLLDLVGFRAINGNLGLEVGDRVLRLAAQRLSQAVQRNDLVARVGGDEFAVLHTEVTSIEDLTTYAQSIQQQMAQPYVLAGETLYLGMSIGIVATPVGEGETLAVLSQADTALQQARSQERGSFAFYSPEMNEALRQRLNLERDLRGALEREELELFYQPQVGGDSLSYRGAEALLRWRHPTRGFVSPGEFIPIAETSGLILPIGQWVLEQAIAQSLAWQKGGYPPLRLAVNLSPKQFEQPDLVPQLQKMLTESTLVPERLELEITEGLLIRDVSRAMATLQACHKLGVAIALDDFGTGYSSLSYLKHFALDYLKIDQSFVRGLPQNPDDLVITRSIVGLAQSLGIELIAKGVETLDQVNLLKDLGCHLLQGYYFAKPLPAAEFERHWQDRLATV
jgi:diguanylate cyclase (GGDEF)-like protein